MYKLFLTLRYLRKRRIAYFAILAVALCVAMVLIVMSVMGGFLDNVKARARGLLGDMIVDNRSVNGFPLYEEFIDDILAWPEIKAATPVLHSYGVLTFPKRNYVQTVRIVGLRLDEVGQINAFVDGLYYERHYPGTTTLAPQQQPRIGCRWDYVIEDGALFPLVEPKSLPQEYEEALKKSYAAGVVDKDRSPDAKSSIRSAAGEPPIVGRFAVNEDNAEDLESDADYVGPLLPGLIAGRELVASRDKDGRAMRYFSKGAEAHLTLVPIGIAGEIEKPNKVAFRYVDDSSTGIYEIDSRYVYCDFEKLQTLLWMDRQQRYDADGNPTGAFTQPRCSQVQISINNDLVRTNEARLKLAKRLQDRYLEIADAHAAELDGREASLASMVEAFTWEQSQAHFIAPVEKERMLVTILFAIISLVAAVLTLCILYMIVLQKTRDIGVIKAIGGSSGGVAAIFITYGAAVGIVGALLGAVFGYYFVIYINDIQEFIASLNPEWRVWDRAVYSFDEIPNTVRSIDIVFVTLFAVVTSTFGSLLAAWRAGAMNPLEALRYE